LDLERPEEALAAQEEALRLGAGLADTYNSRGNSLRALERYAEAIESYEKALRLDPNNASVHYNRGTALLQWDRYPEEALASYARALQLNSEFEFAPGALFYAQQNRADWSIAAPVASPENLRQAVLAGKRVVAPFPFLSATDSAVAQLCCARVYSAYRCASVAPDQIRPYRRHERIRVAYVSADLREHAVSYLMAGVFERHDRKKFEIIAVSLAPDEPTVLGQRVRRAFSRFVEVSKQSDRQVADLLREMEVDIAVDLTGYTDGFRPQIFAHRAAPVQVSYLGFPGTTGAAFMDYILADTFVIPPEHECHYSEHIAYLPGCFQANDDQRPIIDRIPGRTEAGLPQEAFIYCCFNNSYKINPSTFDIWMRVLDRVPGSILWLLGHQEVVRGNLCREAQDRGIDPRRLVFAERRPYAEYLNRLSLADLFLDTLPFNAGTTASDALWAGLPLLTCAGEAFAARMAGSLLHAVGLPELITQSMQDYENRAVELAMRPRELPELRRRLVDSRSTAPLFDTDLFRRDLESAYEEMWRRNQRGEEPASFSVPPSPRTEAR
jgi:predicted O-linked N-acetylglucosamine transferase (SPINDLY family)